MKCSVHVVYWALKPVIAILFLLSETRAAPRIIWREPDVFWEDCAEPRKSGDGFSKGYNKELTISLLSATKNQKSGSHNQERPPVPGALRNRERKVDFRPLQLRERKCQGSPSGCWENMTKAAALPSLPGSTRVSRRPGDLRPRPACLKYSG